MSECEAGAPPPNCPSCLQGCHLPGTTPRSPADPVSRDSNNLTKSLCAHFGKLSINHARAHRKSIPRHTEESYSLYHHHRDIALAVAATHLGHRICSCCPV